MKEIWPVIKISKKALDVYNHSNITIIHQDNQGLGVARNNGIKMAKAPYIIPLDADNKLRSKCSYTSGDGQNNL